MRFLPDTEQRAFAESLHAMLTAADTPSAVRDWGSGDFTRGRALWRRLAEAGVFGLAVPEAYGGVGRHPVELALACVELGRHAVPGPVAETVGAAVLLTALEDPAPAKRLLPEVVSGGTPATLALGTAHTLDADAAGIRLTARGGPSSSRDATEESPGPPAVRGGPPGARQAAGEGPAAELLLVPPPTGPGRRSLDPARRLFPAAYGGEVLATGPQVAVAAGQALTWARLATAAQALGVGLTLLDRTVGHVRGRTQFGVPVGTFQAVKHRLADAKTALEFARPLLFGAALSLRPADVAAAKLRACEAAYATARAALQLHGAIGYTAEYDLSLWLTRARALRSAWGTPQECRDLVLADALGPG